MIFLALNCAIMSPTQISHPEREEKEKLSAKQRKREKERKKKKERQRLKVTSDEFDNTHRMCDTQNP